MPLLTEEPPTPLRAVLVANRGEIAVRVLRAARDAGMRGLAVHAPGDEAALHVRRADAALAVPSYLDVGALTAAARKLGADAVHPGYGFLAENAEFARAVLDAGLVWVGPPPTAMAALADKVAARRLAGEVGAPLAAGTPDPVGRVEEVEAFATEQGLPLVIKAAFGGGGRGLRIVRSAEEIGPAFEAAVREASAASGRGECFVERYLPAARHVEAQVLADAHGSVVVVGTRDCSLQRRHQKLVEEAPAPFLTDRQRAALHTSARQICRAAGYVGAGTVEYLVGADGTLSFLEVNTRLQVEHPVTEETTGVDLVLEQFRIAGGAKLRDEVDPAPQGHAVEFRLVAEDAADEFRPVPGRLTRLEWPAGPGVRVDTGVSSGDAVDGRYDSMFAKLVVSGPDRDTALHRAARALAELVVEGVPTPVPLYRRVVEHPDFAGPQLRVHNRWLSEHAGDLTPAQPGRTGRLAVRVGRRTMPVAVPGLASLGPERTAAILAEAAAGTADAVADSGPAVLAPMHGTIVAVAVTEGQRIEAGELVAVLEAMKMENRVPAHRSGVISAVRVVPGDVVAHRAVLCLVSAPPEPAGQGPAPA